jgi:NitT/TauT family transport system ATP-binding protein
VPSPYPAEPVDSGDAATGTPQKRRAIVQLRGVSKTFRQRESVVRALHDVNLDVHDREFIVLVGASGCGKTTLLNLIADLIQPNTGSIDRTPEIRRPGGIGMVFQSPVLLPWRPILENVLLPAEILGLDRTAARSKAKSLLHLVGLDGFAGAYPYQLSGGMQQRVSMCRSLISDPPVLLMDEPFGALDAITRESMNDELQRIWSETKKTIVFVTHSITEALFLSDRIVVLSARPGRVAGIVKNDIARPRTAQTFKSPAFAEYSVRIREMIEGMDDSDRRIAAAAG